MKPLLLQGHERSITRIKYSREGDLLFSAGKDKRPNVWYSINGERLGTYEGHDGAVWTMDCDWMTRHLLTGAADNTLRYWDIGTGTQIGRVDTKSAVRTCAFSYSSNIAAYTTDKTMGQECTINVIDARDGASLCDQTPILNIPVHGEKVTALMWDCIDETLLTGHANGDISQWDMKTGKRIELASGEHTRDIRDMRPSKDGTMFITACKDNTAKLFDADTLQCLKTYKTERPVNGAAISPKLDHVVVGGGQEAMDVTTTSARVGKFDARFFHLVFEEEFARVKGHFGPINSLEFHPNGDSYASGGEDGFIRVQQFDKSYFDFDKNFFRDLS